MSDNKAKYEQIKILPGITWYIVTIYRLNRNIIILKIMFRFQHVVVAVKWFCKVYRSYNTHSL